MAKIMQLTTEQEQMLVEHREEWRKIGLCCDPADFAAGDEIIRGFYRRLSKPDPIILHFSSPAMCELAVNLVFSLLKDGEPSQLDSQLYSQLGSQLYSQLDSQLRSQLDSQLDSQLYSQLYSQLRSQLRSQLDSQLYSQLGSLKAYFLYNRWGAQHWCAWEAYYLFGHKIGVRYEPAQITLLEEWARLSKSIGWWAPWDGICFVSDRPREVHFDENRRLHSDTGMSCRYSDGWGIHSYHGYHVPDTKAWIITDKAKLNPDTIDAEDNAELRRIMLEIYGFEKYIEVRGAKEIASDEMFGRPRRLLSMRVRGEEIRVLDVHNGSLEPDGTRRRFFLGAMSGANTPHEAVAMSYGIDPAVYSEGART